MIQEKIWNDWKVVIIGCLTLGLTPYLPEPHIVGKIRWVVGGAKGMQIMDWFDFIMHGIPWLLLIRLVIITLTTKKASSNINNQ